MRHEHQALVLHLRLRLILRLILSLTLALTLALAVTGKLVARLADCSGESGEHGDNALRDVSALYSARRGGERTGPSPDPDPNPGPGERALL